MSSEEKEKEGSERPEGGVSSWGDLPSSVREDLLGVGVTGDLSGRCGSFLLWDDSVVFSESRLSGVSVLSVSDALGEFDLVDRGFWWGVVDPDLDDFTRKVKFLEGERGARGYFLRAESGVSVSVPVESCLFMGGEGVEQCVHNVIVAEKGSDLNIVSGCVAGSGVGSGLHVGVSEFFVEEGARLSFTMVHDWASGVVVRPRSGCVVGGGGVFVSNYVVLSPVKSVEMFPTAWCRGENSVARFNNILYARSGSVLDVGSRCVLEGVGASAEIVSRSIAEGGGSVVARGDLVGKVRDTRGHLECRGLLLSDDACIRAVPELSGLVSDTDLSHEAAVGKLARDKVNYLMSRGLTEDQAQSVLIRGFLNIELPGLPEDLKREINQLTKNVARGL